MDTPDTVPRMLLKHFPVCLPNVADWPPYVQIIYPKFSRADAQALAGCANENNAKVLVCTFNAALSFSYSIDLGFGIVAEGTFNAQFNFWTHSAGTQSTIYFKVGRDQNLPATTLGCRNGNFDSVLPFCPVDIQCSPYTRLTGYDDASAQTGQGEGPPQWNLYFWPSDFYNVPGWTDDDDFTNIWQNFYFQRSKMFQISPDDFPYLFSSISILGGGYGNLPGAVISDGIVLPGATTALRGTNNGFFQVVGGVATPQAGTFTLTGFAGDVLIEPYSTW